MNYHRRTIREILRSSTYIFLTLRRHGPVAHPSYFMHVPSERYVAYNSGPIDISRRSPWSTQYEHC